MDAHGAGKLGNRLIISGDCSWPTHLWGFVYEWLGIAWVQWERVGYEVEAWKEVTETGWAKYFISVIPILVFLPYFGESKAARFLTVFRARFNKLRVSSGP